MFLKKAGRFFKVMVLLPEAHALVCISLSYVYAALGIEQTLEGLSGILATEIVAPLAIYGITKTVENIFEKNDFLPKKLKKEMEDYEKAHK